MNKEEEHCVIDLSSSCVVLHDCILVPDLPTILAKQDTFWKNGVEIPRAPSFLNYGDN
ncbi:unnamed protein product, partial [Larinioides sclopetarius]